MYTPKWATHAELVKEIHDELCNALVPVVGQDERTLVESGFFDIEFFWNDRETDTEWGVNALVALEPSLDWIDRLLTMRNEYIASQPDTIVQFSQFVLIVPIGAGACKADLSNPPSGISIWRWQGSLIRPEAVPVLSQLGALVGINDVEELMGYFSYDLEADLLTELFVCEPHEQGTI